MREETIDAIARVGLIPLLDVRDGTVAPDVGRTLLGAGLPIIEVALRNATALEAIYRMRTAVPDLLVGAGTVLSGHQASQALDAGAQFLVSPGLEPAVAEVCRIRGLPYFPGVATATEIMQCLSLGLRVLKFFPAEASGGIPWTKAIAGPFPGIQLIPTGGISESNLVGYLDAPNVVACGGSWITRPDVVQRKDFETLRASAEGALAMVRQAKVKSGAKDAHSQAHIPDSLAPAVSLE